MIVWPRSLSIWQIASRIAVSHIAPGFRNNRFDKQHQETDRFWDHDTQKDLLASIGTHTRTTSKENISIIWTFLACNLCITKRNLPNQRGREDEIKARGCRVGKYFISKAEKNDLVIIPYFYTWTLHPERLEKQPYIPGNNAICMSAKKKKKPTNSYYIQFISNSWG
jgi:hypothetical protein